MKNRLLISQNKAQHFYTRKTYLCDFNASKVYFNHLQNQLIGTSITISIILLMAPDTAAV